MISEEIFEAALSISSLSSEFDMMFGPRGSQLRIRGEFEVSNRFALPGQTGELGCTTQSPRPIAARTFSNTNRSSGCLSSGSICLMATSRKRTDRGSEAHNRHTAVRGIRTPADAGDALRGRGAHQGSFGPPGHGPVREVHERGGQ
jgi:hypothetical protein